MSLLSKLFGGGKEGESALDVLKEAAKEAVNEAAAKANSVASTIKNEAANTREESSRSSSYDSYWDEIPAEENQYNFNGYYVDYFSKVFREEFPEYNINCENGNDGRSTVFSFWFNGAQALIVELKSEKSSSQKLRRACETSGIPYLRFYYDHSGWWNTRSYVTERTRRALGR